MNEEEVVELIKKNLSVSLQVTDSSYYGQSSVNIVAKVYWGDEIIKTSDEEFIYIPRVRDSDY